MRGKSFLLLFLVAASVAACFAGAAETPLFRAGLMTDTHWGLTPETFERTEGALKVFKREKVDLVCHLGDIADLHYPWAYRYYRELFGRIFPDAPPRELFVYANHDVLTRDKHGSAVKMDIDKSFADMRRELKIPNAPSDKLVFKGLPILIFPQFLDKAEVEKNLAETARKFPGKPIFVLDHVPASRNDAGKEDFRRIAYGRYPNVVHIYGHVHTPLRDENSIWQGTHTEVGAGCLQNWRGSLIGTSPGNKECYEFAIMDVVPDKLVFRRYSTEDGREFKEPWIVPLPFDPATAPYRPDARRAAVPAPEFAPDAKLTLKANRPFSALGVRWPGATRGGEAYKYFVVISVREPDGSFRDVSRRDSYSEFYLAENKRKGTLSQRLSAGFFEPGRRYRISVTPVGFFGGRGKALAAEFTPPTDVLKTETIFECTDPMKELVFASGLSGAKPLPVKGGFYQHKSGNARLIIPKKYWAGAKGARFRFTVDMDTRQPEDNSWTMVLRNPVPLTNGNNRLKTLGGKADGQRYVIELGKKNAKFFYDLLIREGGPGEIRFKYVKLERLP